MSRRGPRRIAVEHLPTHPEVRITGCNTFHCHYQGTGVAGHLTDYVLRIRPIAPGWREVLFRPHPGDLTSASGRFITPHGELAAEWNRKDGHYNLHLQMPPGVSARVRFRGLDAIVRNTSF